MDSYLIEFEAIANILEGLFIVNLMSCFIYGLKSNIHREVVAQQPTIVSLVAGLARLKKDKLQDLTCASRPCSWKPASNTKMPLNWITGSPSSMNSTKPAPSILPTPSRKQQFCHLSGPEMDERCEKGLCFSCDQKLSLHHKCGGKYGGSSWPRWYWRVCRCYSGCPIEMTHLL